MRKIAYIILITGIIMISIGIILQIIDIVNKEKCYNLPIDEFYKNKDCLKILSED